MSLISLPTAPRDLGVIPQDASTAQSPTTPQDKRLSIDTVKTTSEENSIVSRACLKDIPEELIINILCLLHGVDVSRCSEVNRNLRLIILHSKRLQYMITLAKYRYIDTPRFSGSERYNAAKRLDLLQSNNDSWRTLEVSRTKFEIPNGDCYDFVGGILATITGYSVNIVELPSRLRSTPLRERTLTVGFKPIAVAVNPDQDLLVLAEPITQIAYCGLYPGGSKQVASARLHFRTISDGKRHPLATLPYLDTRYARDNFQISCFSGYIALSYNAECVVSEGCVGTTVVDWKKGVDIGSSLSLSRYYSTKPLFLTPTTLLAIENSIGGAKLVVSRIEGDYLHTARSFELPTKAGYREECRNIVRGSPPVDPSPYGPYAKPFALEDDSRVIHIEQHITSTYDDSYKRYVSTVVPVHHLLSLCGDYYPWKDGTPRFPAWGDSSTHTEARTRPPKCIAVHGSRVIDLDSALLLRVADYRRGGSHWEPREPGHTKECGPGRDLLHPSAAKPSWLDEIPLNIPSVRTSCLLPECAGRRVRVRLMMDEEHILVCKGDATATDGHTNLKVTVFTL